MPENGGRRATDIPDNAPRAPPVPGRSLSSRRLADFALDSGAAVWNRAEPPIDARSIHPCSRVFPPGNGSAPGLVERANPIEEVNPGFVPHRRINGNSSESPGASGLPGADGKSRSAAIFPDNATRKPLVPHEFFTLSKHARRNFSRSAEQRTRLCVHACRLECAPLRRKGMRNRFVKLQSCTWPSKWLSRCTAGRKRGKKTNLSPRLVVSRRGGCAPRLYLAADTRHYFQLFYLPPTRLAPAGTVLRALESMCPRRAAGLPAFPFTRSNPRERFSL